MQLLEVGIIFQYCITLPLFMVPYSCYAGLHLLIPIKYDIFISVISVLSQPEKQLYILVYRPPECERTAPGRACGRLRLRRSPPHSPPPPQYFNTVHKTFGTVVEVGIIYWNNILVTYDTVAMIDMKENIECITSSQHALPTSKHEGARSARPYNTVVTTPRARWTLL